MVDDETNSDRLLARMRHHLEAAFPNAQIREFSDGKTGNRGYIASEKGEQRGVAATEIFLDADGGVEAGLAQLDKLPDKLAQLGAGMLLIVRSEEFSESRFP